MREPAHRALHPFGQIPTYEEGGLALFESGAIVFHIADRHAGLLPGEANARARAVGWMFAALGTMEPPIVDREIVELVERDKTWYEPRLAAVEGRIRNRLGELCSRLGDCEWLDGTFSAGDLVMVDVLRRLSGSGMLGEYPSLAAMSPAAKRGPPSSVPSQRNWRSSSRHRRADSRLHSSTQPGARGCVRSAPTRQRIPPHGRRSDRAQRPRQALPRHSWMRECESRPNGRLRGSAGRPA
jgi:glutathione S-transferase